MPDAQKQTMRDGETVEADVEALESAKVKAEGEVEAETEASIQVQCGSPMSARVHFAAFQAESSEQLSCDQHSQTEVEDNIAEGEKARVDGKTVYPLHRKHTDRTYGTNFSDAVSVDTTMITEDMLGLLSSSRNYETGAESHLQAGPTSQASTSSTSQARRRSPSIATSGDEMIMIMSGDDNELKVADSLVQATSLTSHTSQVRDPSVATSGDGNQWFDKLTTESTGWREATVDGGEQIQTKSTEGSFLNFDDVFNEGEEVVQGASVRSRLGSVQWKQAEEPPLDTVSENEKPICIVFPIADTPIARINDEFIHSARQFPTIEKSSSCGSAPSLEGDRRQHPSDIKPLSSYAELVDSLDVTPQAVVISKETKKITELDLEREKLRQFEMASTEKNITNTDRYDMFPLDSNQTGQSVMVESNEPLLETVKEVELGRNGRNGTTISGCPKVGRATATGKQEPFNDKPLGWDDDCKDPESTHCSNIAPPECVDRYKSDKTLTRTQQIIWLIVGFFLVILFCCALSWIMVEKEKESSRVVDEIIEKRLEKIEKKAVPEYINRKHDAVIICVDPTSGQAQWPKVLDLTAGGRKLDSTYTNIGTENINLELSEWKLQGTEYWRKTLPEGFIPHHVEVYACMALEFCEPLLEKALADSSFEYPLIVSSGGDSTILYVANMAQKLLKSRFRIAVWTDESGNDAGHSLGLQPYPDNKGCRELREAETQLCIMWKQWVNMDELVLTSVRETIHIYPGGTFEVPSLPGEGKRICSREGSDVKPQCAGGEGDQGWAKYYNVEAEDENGHNKGFTVQVRTLLHFVMGELGEIAYKARAAQLADNSKSGLSRIWSLGWHHIKNAFSAPFSSSSVGVDRIIIDKGRQQIPKPTESSFLVLWARTFLGGAELENHVPSYQGCSLFDVSRLGGFNIVRASLLWKQILAGYSYYFSNNIRSGKAEKFTRLMNPLGKIQGSISLEMNRDPNTVAHVSADGDPMRLQGARRITFTPELDKKIVFLVHPRVKAEVDLERQLENEHVLTPTTETVENQSSSALSKAKNTAVTPSETPSESVAPQEAQG